MTLRVNLRATSPISLDVAFEVAAGELLALVGPSGAGKTSILRMIAGLSTPGAGQISVNGAVWLDTALGVNLPPHRRDLGVVFQSYALFPHMTAAGNVIAALPRATPDAQAEAERLLALVNLPGLSDRRPAQLSGGQQQRVALARALARRPAALLLDEPFSAVDRATRERLHTELIGLRRHLNMPVILVTHDMTEAQILADRMVVLDRGAVVRQGPVAEVMSDPLALQVMGLRELAAMLPAQIAAQEDDGLTRLNTAAGPIWLSRIEGPAGTPVRVRILAHEVILSRHRPEGLSAQNILPATITRIVPTGDSALVIHLAVGDGSEILARITRRAAQALDLAPGDTAFAILKAMSVARDHVAVS